MNNIKHILLKKRSVILILTLIVILFGASCREDEKEVLKQPTAEWTLSGKEKNVSFTTTVENNLLYAIDVQYPKRKLSVKFGVKPTTSTILKVVDYFKVPLAADEMIIGIADDNFYYLSTGTDNATISPSVTVDVTTNTVTNISINFNNLRVGRHDINFNPLDVTTATGYISKN